MQKYDDFINIRRRKQTINIIMIKNIPHMKTNFVTQMAWIFQIFQKKRTLKTCTEIIKNINTSLF